MQTTLIYFSILLLSGCVHFTAFRAKGHPVAPGEFENVKDAPALINLADKIIEVRSQEFNSTIILGLVIRPKDKDIIYTKTEVHIETLRGQTSFKSSGYEKNIRFLCSDKPWSDNLVRGDVKFVTVSKNCPLFISYSFDTTPSLLDIFKSDEIESGFKYVDAGFDANHPLEVEFFPYVSKDTK